MPPAYLRILRLTSMKPSLSLCLTLRAGGRLTATLAASPSPEPKRPYLVIEETTSPNEQYAVAWALPKGPALFSDGKSLKGAKFSLSAIVSLINESGNRDDKGSNIRFELRPDKKGRLSFHVPGFSELDLEERPEVQTGHAEARSSGETSFCSSRLSLSLTKTRNRAETELVT